MRSRQPTLVFAFTVIAGLLRLAAYAGTSTGLDLSVSALLHYVALHILTFAFAAFLVASLSRATATRAAFVALYAQAVLFVSAFVDVAIGFTLSDYGQTYAGLFGGSPGAIVGVLAYAAVVAWGVHDATLGPRTPRVVGSAVAGIAGVLGLSFLAIPWPRIALLAVPGWSLHLALAAYFSVLGLGFLSLAVLRANPAAFRAAWRHVTPERMVGFSVLPIVGVVAAARLLVPEGPGEPALRYLIELPYVVAGMMSAGALWIQWRVIRARDWGPTRLEFATVAKIVALAFALPLGLLPFLAAALAGSAAWIGLVPRGDPVVGIVGAFDVLIGSLTVVAVDFAQMPLGPSMFLLPIDQNPSLTLAIVSVSAIVGVLVASVSFLTNRISASGRGRASS